MSHPLIRVTVYFWCNKKETATSYQQQKEIWCILFSVLYHLLFSCCCLTLLPLPPCKIWILEFIFSLSFYTMLSVSFLFSKWKKLKGHNDSNQCDIKRNNRPIINISFCENQQNNEEIHFFENTQRVLKEKWELSYMLFDILHPETKT